MSQVPETEWKMAGVRWRDHLFYNGHNEHPVKLQPPVQSSRPWACTTTEPAKSWKLHQRFLLASLVIPSCHSRQCLQKMGRPRQPVIKWQWLENEFGPLSNTAGNNGRNGGSKGQQKESSASGYSHDLRPRFPDVEKDAPISNIVADKKVGDGRDGEICQNFT